MSQIRKQLLALSRKNNNFEQLVSLYVREGLVARFSQSDLGQKYILKGASVFQILAGAAHRTTKDIDFLGYGPSNEASLAKEFGEIINIKIDDGLEFNAIATSILQAGQKYQGIRLEVNGTPSRVPIKGQIDVGFGSIVYPAPVQGNFPTLLSSRQPIPVLHYPKETVVAEKFEALTSLGLRNSRLKDFYDLLYLARNVEFDGNPLSVALTKTFKRRGTELPTTEPVGLTPKYVTYDSKREQLWKNLYSEGQMGHRPKLREAIAEISGFIMPVARAAAENRPFHQSWQPQTGWQRTPVNFKDYEGRMQKVFPLPKFQDKSSQTKNTELE